MVSASQTRIASVLGGKNQLRMPLYQRRYAWERKEWEALWSDVLHLALDRQTFPSERHFLGSVVLAPTPNKAADARLVIDGQQRLLTVSLLLCALRDAESRLPAGLRARIDRCLVMASREGGPLKRLKFQPTQFDQNAFSRVVHGTELIDKDHRATKAYNLFKKWIASLQNGEDENVEGVTAGEVVRAVLDGIECVRVIADDGDNVHRIFESLNNRGQALTQADLIRNYVFMRLPTKAEDFHEYTWKPLEERFSAEELTQLFWLDLVRDRPSITQRQTYVEQQKKLQKVSPEGLKQEIEQVVWAGKFWDRILRPEGERSKRVRTRLERLRDWRTTTVWPVLMALLEERDSRAASIDEVAQAMLYLESYFVRRVVIGRATDNMNRVLLQAPLAIRKSREPVDIALRRYLSEGGKHWASDEELREQVATKAFYHHGKAFQKTLILSWLELELAGGDISRLAGDLTIEHIMPQSLTPDWRASVKAGAAPGENVDHLHSGLVNTLGNLTLARAGRNSQMGNKSFADKKAVLAKHGSGLQMTKEITKKHHWRPADIRKRSAVMVERIITTWPGPVEF